MAHWIKCLSCKHEVQSPDAKKAYSSRTGVVVDSKLSTQEAQIKSSEHASDRLDVL